MGRVRQRLTQGYAKHVSYVQLQETWSIKIYQWEEKEHLHPHNQEKL